MRGETLVIIIVGLKHQFLINTTVYKIMMLFKFKILHKLLSNL